MDFEWDGEKSDAAPTERGFDFEFAIGIFVGPVIEIEDARKDYGEPRAKAIGETQGFILAVDYTDRLEAPRIISARLANKKERAMAIVSRTLEKARSAARIDIASSSISWPRSLRLPCGR